MTSIGETLRAERLRRRLDVQAIALELKISAKFLEAIEQEQFDRLPATVFAKSFLRQYARYLGLAEEDLVQSFEQTLEPPVWMAGPHAEKFETPAIQVERMAEWQSVGDDRRNWSSTLPALALMVVVMLACSGVYAWLQRNRHAAPSHDQSQSTVSVATPQQPVAPAATTPAARPAPPPNSAAPGTPGAAPGTVERIAESTPPAAADAADRSATLASGSPPTAAGSSSAAGGSSSTAGAPGAVHVEVVATGEVWVSAKADDKTTFMGTLQANQSRVVDAQRMVVLRLGNAGGADITLNGKPIGPVGPKGHPLTIQLTPGGFQIVASPSAPDLLDPL